MPCARWEDALDGLGLTTEVLEPLWSRLAALPVPEPVPSPAFFHFLAAILDGVPRPARPRGEPSFRAGGGHDPGRRGGPDLGRRGVARLERRRVAALPAGKPVPRRRRPATSSTPAARRCSQDEPRRVPGASAHGLRPRATGAFPLAGTAAKLPRPAGFRRGEPRSVRSQQGMLPQRMGAALHGGIRAGRRARRQAAGPLAAHDPPDARGPCPRSAKARARICARSGRGGAIPPRRSTNIFSTLSR